MNEHYKIVAYDLYCDICKYKELKEDEDPCHDCLNNPVNEDSKKPLYFEKRIVKNA